jgi:catechol 2,3-dioxygenase-like lactoylglutathione lyase family enzyme
MPIVKPNLEPPFNVVRASHVAFGVPDLDRARAFYVDCLGLMETARDKDTLYLRGVEERNHHSLVLRQARAAEIHALGFKLAGETDLDQAAAMTPLQRPLLPPPLWGRVGVGGRAVGHCCAASPDPHPRPLPTRGRGEEKDLIAP